ncbi:MAG: RNA-binding S4 domain-containing protein [Bacteroidetes bacterium]|nr:RNA-binding S4 domain-containing protein [Bacteroidota bacterium]
MNTADAERDKVRLDKWLWSVRIYKSRKLAAEACEGGKVKLNGKSAKAASKIQIGDEIHLFKDGLNRIYKVLAYLSKRVGAPLVSQYMEDLTPEDELINHQIALRSAFHRPRGLGRPTKKERRKMDDIMDN